MSHYRDLNKELVEQVQAMRKNMKLYCDEIVYLKAELLQKRETEVILRKQCYNWAVNSFVQLIQSVQPDSEILPILEEHIHSGERLSDTSTRSQHPWPARRSDARRRSSVLTLDFQRSNSIINLRKSVCSTSPIRRSSMEASVEDEPQNIPEDAEVMGNEEVEDNDATESDMPRNTNIEDIIFEESNEEEEEIYNCEDIDVESVYESVEEISVNISENRGTLYDITNLLKSTKISTKTLNIPENTAKRRAPSKRTKKKNMSGKENSSDENLTSKDDSDIDITKLQNKVGHTTFAENERMNEETLQEPRRYSNSRRYHNISKSFALNQNNGQITNNEVTLGSPTLVLNDITLQNFKDAACSTPNSRQHSLEATSTNHCETVSIIQSSSNTSSRPSRHCKPTNLAEPHLGTKLRNESDAKPKRNRKTKPKPKTKK